MRKKITAVTLSLAMGLAMCVPAAASGSDAIELEINLSTDSAGVFDQIVADFTDETGIDVNVVKLGSDYEAAMKTKMASNDLPDMWVTHGWSILRYSEYLMDLSDQEWVDRIDDDLKDILTDDDGKIYCLSITKSIEAIMYNRDVTDAAGVDVTKIRTWDDFDAACEKIYDAGYVPIEVVLQDGYGGGLPVGIWPTLYTNEGCENQEENVAAMKGGTFDWAEHTECQEMITKWYENNWFNEDYTSGKQDQVFQALADGDAAFLMYATLVIPPILAMNPDANIGIMPYPSVAEDAPSYFAVGEADYASYGIYKDTKHEEECKQLLDYFARPDVAAKIAAIEGGIPGIAGIELEDEGITYSAVEYARSQEEFDGDLFYDNVFDREYMPSGMWSVMEDSIDLLLADGDPAGMIEESAEMIAENYYDLYKG